MRKTLILIALTSALTGCNRSEHLLSIPVTSSESIPATEVNRQLQALDTSGGVDASPLAVVAQLWQQPSAGMSAISVERSADATGYEAIVILDAIPGDDSVSGWHYALRLGKTATDKWQVTELRRSWRCWSGRGHRDFSIEPCT